jgi:acetyl esterase/lipase
VKRVISLLSAMLVAVSIANAQSSRSGLAKKARGELVSAKLSNSYTAEQVATIIRKNIAWTGHDEVINELISSATAIDTYVISYHTLNAKGRKTIASGLVGIPSPSTGTYPVFQYHHGTQFNNQDVPSNVERSSEATVCLAIFAAHGYVTSLPDFIGQGKGKPPHPYLMTGPMATATTDMLKAVNELCSQLEVKTNSQLFISGLSEGGHATLALQQRIETDTDSQPFTLTASGPIAGPYDVRGEWDYMLESKPQGCTPLALHFYLSYRKIYGFKDKMKEVFIAPYNRQVKKIDNGTLNFEEMYLLLPETTQELMQANFLSELKSGLHPMYQIMEGNNAYNFLPKTPTRLYHGSEDKLVPYSMSEMTCARMKLLGTADVEVVNVGAYNHPDSLVPSLLMQKEWFESLMTDAP